MNRKKKIFETLKRIQTDTKLVFWDRLPQQLLSKQNHFGCVKIRVTGNNGVLTSVFFSLHTGENDSKTRVRLSVSSSLLGWYVAERF